MNVETLVTTKHVCDVCNKHFDEQELEEALEHAKIPIKEGDYNGVVVRDEGDEHYIIFVGGGVSKSHERIYNYSHMAFFELNLYRERIETRPICLPSDKELPVSEIESGKYKSLETKELKDLNAMHKKGLINDFFTGQIKKGELRTLK